MRRARRVAIALLALLALAALVERVLGRLSLEGRRAEIERALSAAFGREVRIDGELRFDLLPQPALEATEVVVANPPGRAAPELLRIESSRLVLALGPLLRRRLELARLQVDGAVLRLETGAGEVPDLLPSLARLAGGGAPSGPSLALRVDRIDLDRVHVAWQDVASAAVTTLDLDEFDLVADGDDEPIEWSALGSFRGEEFGFEARGGTLAELLQPSRPWPIDLEGHAGEASVRLHGAIAQPARFAGLDLELDLELPNVGRLLAPASPALGAARLRGHLADPGGEHGLDRIAVESDPAAELRLRVQGSVRRLADPSGIELEGEAEADRLRFLELLLERPMPDGRADAKFRLSDRDGTLGLEGEAHARSRDGSLRVDLSGGFGDLRAVDEIDAAVRIAAPALDALGRQAGLDRELPALGPVAASARVRARAGSVGIERLELEAGRRGETWLSLRGRLRDLRALRGVALEASAGARSLSALGSALRPARSLPDLGPFDLRAKLADAQGPLAIDRFELRGGAPETLAVDVTGRIADVRKLDAIEIEGQLETRDPARLGSRFGVEVPALAPLAFSGRVRGSDERIEAEGTASFGQTQLEGRGTAELAREGRPRVAAELRSAHLRLEDVGLGARAAGREHALEPEQPPRRAEEPLDFAVLRQLDARLGLRADRATAGDSVELRDVHASAELEDGDLHLRDVGLEYEGGRIAGEARLDARTPDPEAALRADARALDLARLGVALGRPDLTGSGQLDLALDLRSGGATPQALRERLAGRAAFAAREWSAASPLARRFLTDLTRAFVPKFGRAPERVGCFQGALALAQGVARVESLVLSGERATVVGAGSVDLVREEWNLELVPEIHDPGLLEVASAVRVTGPLADPRFKPVPLDLVAGTLRGLARGALSPARKVTGGAGRLLGPAGRVLAPVERGLGLGARAAPDTSACSLPEPAP